MSKGVRRAGQVSQPMMIFPRCVLVLPPRALHALRASSRLSALCLVSALVVMTRHCRVFGTGPPKPVSVFLASNLLRSGLCVSRQLQRL